MLNRAPIATNALGFGHRGCTLGENFKFFGHFWGLGGPGGLAHLLGSGRPPVWKDRKLVTFGGLGGPGGPGVGPGGPGTRVYRDPRHARGTVCRGVLTWCGGHFKGLKNMCFLAGPDPGNPQNGPITGSRAPHISSDCPRKSLDFEIRT